MTDGANEDTGDDDGDERLQPPTESIRPLSERLVDEAGAGGQRGSEPGRDRRAAAVNDGQSMDPLVAVYRHDLHKARMRSHEHAAETFAGVPVNEPVPLGADGDAAMLSRPRGEPEQTVANHASSLRVSLLTGSVATSVGRTERGIHPAIRELMQIDEPEAMHAAWLDSSVAAIFNESVYYPYTSLKYHTLLAAALLDNYRAGYAFWDLYLAVDPPADESGEAGEREPSGGSGVVPHRTVLTTPLFALRVTGSPGERPSARLGAVPAQSWADLWSRLPLHPIETDGERVWRVLDAQLRRIRSWSVALQFIEEFVAWGRAIPFRDPTGSDDTRGAGQ